jgi:hypothetical protein
VVTTAIWAVKGQLGRVVEYVENPEKTLTRETLRDVLDYAAQPHKTRQLVSGVNCAPATAQSEMLDLQIHFGKNRSIAACHGYQSFAAGEVTPEQCHSIGVALARELWGEKYQVLVATHLDRVNHLHNHFVLNPVSFVDGKRQLAYSGILAVYNGVVFAAYAFSVAFAEGAEVQAQILPHLRAVRLSLGTFWAVRALHGGLAAMLCLWLMRLFPQAATTFAGFGALLPLPVSHSFPAAAALLMMGALLILDGGLHSRE